MIFIKGFKKYYSLENKLLKIPATSFGDFYKKKESNYKGGKISCLLKIPKNSFESNEILPFEIYLNCRELNMEISNIKVSLKKELLFLDNNYKNCLGKYDKNYINVEKSQELLSKDYPIDNHLTMYEIKDNFNIPLFYDNLSILYYRLDLLKEVEIDYDYNNKSIQLLPFCHGDLIIIEFILIVEIIYKIKKMKNDILKLPIEIYEKNLIENENIPLIPDIKSNQKQNENINKNNSLNYDINSNDKDELNINKNKEIEISKDFVVYEKDDFEKSFYK